MHQGAPNRHGCHEVHECDGNNDKDGIEIEYDYWPSSDDWHVDACDRVQSHELDHEDCEDPFRKTPQVNLYGGRRGLRQTPMQRMNELGRERSGLTVMLAHPRQVLLGRINMEPQASHNEVVHDKRDGTQEHLQGQ